MNKNPHPLESLRTQMRLEWYKACKWEGMPDDELGDWKFVQFSPDNPFMGPNSKYEKMQRILQAYMKSNPLPSEDDTRELVHLYHLASGKGDRHSKLIWAAVTFHRRHPAINAINAYMAVDDATRSTRNPKKLLKIPPHQPFTVTCASCGARGMTHQGSWYFDPNGRPFKDYFCERCAHSASAKNPLQDSIYAGFHQAQPAMARKVERPIAHGNIHAIGKAVRIEYEPFGNSRHVGTRFFHDFGDLGGKKIKERPILVSDDRGDIFFVPTHPKYPHFSDRGILG